MSTWVINSGFYHEVMLHRKILQQDLITIQFFGLFTTKKKPGIS